jgi:TPP-dependent pyruvate/acetoin dehydrogenase alpha subunit
LVGLIRKCGVLNAPDEDRVAQAYELYRNKAEVEQWKQRCPIITYTRLLKASGDIDDAGLAALEKAVAAEIGSAVDFAEAGSWEPVSQLTRDVYTVRSA